MKIYKKMLVVLVATVIAMVGFTKSIDAASIARTGKLGGTFNTTYHYAYNYSAMIYYDAGTGRVTSADTIKTSNKTCASLIGLEYGCSINTSQASKTINYASVKYVVKVDVYANTGWGGGVYVGSQNNTVTLSSPGPTRGAEPLETIEIGEMYTDLRLVENFVE
ncbi:hypothetical protein A4S06_11605 [Erysipelotrichaceae bacterium MTC7]|nr:hypothetical protein A4S06_11605 [Erysipelotrichaceae bacterium MTC7]